MTAPGPGIGLERAVWEAVRRGDRSGTVISSGVVFARTGVRLTHEQVRDAVAALLADGRLYWRGAGQRVQRRVLAGPWPESAQPPAPQPALFELDAE